MSLGMLTLIASMHLHRLRVRDVDPGSSDGDGIPVVRQQRRNVPAQSLAAAAVARRSHLELHEASFCCLAVLHAASQQSHLPLPLSSLAPRRRL
eukprot:3940065-Rhodomonas_salina.2